MFMSFLWYILDNSLILDDDNIKISKTGAFIKIISIKFKIKTLHLLSSYLREDLKTLYNLDTLNTLKLLIKSVN